jgi:hypothetical protein
MVVTAMVLVRGPWRCGHPVVLRRSQMVDAIEGGLQLKGCSCSGCRVDGCCCWDSR